MPLIVCTTTGTVLAFESCALVQDDVITDDDFDNSSDNEIAALAKERGTLLSSIIPSPTQP